MYYSSKLINPTTKTSTHFMYKALLPFIASNKTSFVIETNIDSSETNFSLTPVQRTLAAKLNALFRELSENALMSH